MKKFLLLVFLMLIFISAATISTSKPDAMHTMEGTWEQVTFYNYDGDKVDTVKLIDGYRQVKMYYNGKVMWSRTDPNDTVGRFGYGRYHITDKELIEDIEYGDHSMMRALQTLRNFRFELILTDSTYSQISYDEDGNRTFSENYKRID